MRWFRIYISFTKPCHQIRLPFVEWTTQPKQLNLQLRNNTQAINRMISPFNYIFRTEMQHKVFPPLSNSFDISKYPDLPLEVLVGSSVG